MIEGILAGLSVAFSPVNLMMLLVGCAAGTFIGMLPGLGPISAIALMIPVTYSFDPATGLILMAAVYYGAVFGGSTSSILINAPGIAGTVATAFDGFPMAQKGMAGKALAIAAVASFCGGTVAAVLLLVAAPALATVSLSFRSPDYFALMVLGLSAMAAFSGRGKVLRAMMMAIVGLMLATVGTDLNAGVQRFTFGRLDLLEGVDFVLLAMAVFALAEALSGVLKKTSAEFGRGDMRRISELKITRAEAKEMAPPVARSSLLGFLVGVLPGAGATIASFLAYGMERALAPLRARGEFGKGSVRGLAAPETANNAACSGSFVPLLTLGIPGSGTTAVMLGALVSYGVRPGPRLYLDNPEVFWSVIVSMYLGNIVLLILNLPLIPYIARVLATPRAFLLPLIFFFSLAGVYLLSRNPFDIWLMAGIALAATALRLADYPMAPLLLGFVLGGMLEDNLRRSLALSDGSWSFLWDRPLTLFILILAAASFALPPLASAIANRRKKAAG